MGNATLSAAPISRIFVESLSREILTAILIGPRTANVRIECAYMLPSAASPELAICSSSGDLTPDTPTPPTHSPW